MHDVFISYSHVDKNIADSICHRIECEGIRCWYAPRDIAPGKDWREAIMESISSAKVFILVYTKDSNQSRQVLNEVTAAFDASCTIIPFRMESVAMAPALSYYLKNVHWLDAMLPPRDTKVAELADTVKRILDTAPSGAADKPYPHTPASAHPSPAKKQMLIPIIALILAVSLLLGAGMTLLSGSDEDTTPSTEQTAPPVETTQAVTEPSIPFTEDPAAIDAACESVVQIRCYVNGSCVSAAGGFACFDDHVIVTNAHVVLLAYPEDNGDALDANAAQNVRIEITTESNLTFTITEILVLDRERDVAILSTTGSHGIPLLEPGETQALQRGEKLVAISTQFTDQNVVTFGEFSSISVVEDSEMIMFSKPLSAGGSGSALLNHQGKVVGILGISNKQASFAVPIEDAQVLWAAYING